MPGKTTIPNFTLEPTSHDNLFRYVDANGDWTYYVFKKGNKKDFYPAVNHILDVGFNKGRGFMEYLLSVDKTEARQKLETAGERGSRVHQAISHLIQMSKVTMDTKYYNTLKERDEVLSRKEWKCLQAFVKWVGEFKPHTLLNEHASFSTKYEFAGTPDWYGTVELPKIGRVWILIDWKTSAGIWGDYPLQVASYAQMYNEHGVEGIKNAYTAILRVGTRHKSGYEFKVYTPEETRDNLGVFSAVRAIFEYAKPKFKSDVIQIPYSFNLKIPNEKSSEQKNDKATSRVSKRPKRNKSNRKSNPRKVQK